MDSFDRKYYSKLLRSIFKFEIEAIALTGSVSTGENTNDSDVDLLLLTNAVDQIVVENHLVQEQEYQFILIPLFDLEKLLLYENLNGRSLYASMIQKSKVVYDRGKHIERAKQASTKYNQSMEFKRELTDRRIYDLRYQLTSLLQDVKGASDLHEKIYLSTELLKKTSSLLVFLNQYTCEPESKYLYRSLKQSGTDQELCKIYRKTIATSDFQLLCDYVSSVLNQVGGKLVKYSATSAAMGVHADQLCIHINESKLSVTKTLVKIIRKITSCFYLFKHEEADYCELGIYILIWMPKNTINQSILPLLKREMKEKLTFQEVKKVSLAYQANYFFMVERRTLLSPDLSKILLRQLSVFVLQKQLYSLRNERLKYGIHMLLLLGIVCFRKINFKRLLLQCKTQWVGKAVGNGKQSSLYIVDVLLHQLLEWEQTQLPWKQLADYYQTSIEKWSLDAFPDSELNEVSKDLHRIKMEEQNPSTEMRSMHTINKIFDVLFLEKQEKYYAVSILCNMLK